MSGSVVYQGEKGIRRAPKALYGSHGSVSHLVHHPMSHSRPSTLGLLALVVDVYVLTLSYFHGLSDYFAFYYPTFTTVPFSTPKKDHNPAYYQEFII